MKGEEGRQAPSATIIMFSQKISDTFFFQDVLGILGPNFLIICQICMPNQFKSIRDTPLLHHLNVDTMDVIVDATITYWALPSQ